MEAKPVTYGGVSFRSTLEFRWSVFFDCLKVKWLYEPQSFSVGGSGYIPDFWLPEYESFVEIKPVLVGLRIDKPIALAEKVKVAVLVGKPMPGIISWFGFPGKKSNYYHSEFGFCRKCERMMLCVKPSAKIWLPVLMPATECRHSFIESSCLDSFPMLHLSFIRALAESRKSSNSCGVTDDGKEMQE